MTKTCLYFDIKSSIGLFCADLDYSSAISLESAAAALYPAAIIFTAEWFLDLVCCDLPAYVTLYHAQKAVDGPRSVDQTHIPVDDTAEGGAVCSHLPIKL